MKFGRVFAVAALVFCVCLMLFPLPIFAQNGIEAPRLNVPIPGLDFTQHPIIRDGDKLTIPFFAAYVSAANRYIVGISAIAAAIMIVYGGFLYIVGTSLSSVKRGKEIIQDAVIGLILILGVYIILVTVNADLVNLKGLTVTTVRNDPYISHVANKDGIPVDKMNAWDRPDYQPTVAGDLSSPNAGGPVPAAGTTTKSGSNCGASSPYRPSSPSCNGDACRSLFCEQKNYSVSGPYPKPDELFGFDDFPATIGQQIAEKGLAMVPPGGAGSLCFRNCDASKYLTTLTFGPSVSNNMKNLMQGNRVFRKDARDALIRAGAAAKEKGYFIAIGDGTRSMEGQATEWCRRIKEEGSPKGMATPGSSPHQLGIAVDIGLFRLVGNKYEQLTQIGSICNQVSNMDLLGLDNLRTLEGIMFSAGWKHMCSEVWHFNYLGVYESDCEVCNFPGDMETRVKQDKTCK